MTVAGGSAAGAVIFTACGVPEDELLVEAPLDLPEDLVRGTDTWYATHDPTSPGGPGIIVRVMEGRAKKIAGNPDYPVNLGKQATHADTALQMLYHPDRLTTPMLRRSKGGVPVPISWAEAEGLLNGYLAGSLGRVVVATSPMRGSDAAVLGRFTDALGGRYLFFDPLEQGVLHRAIKAVFGQDRLPEFDIGRSHTVLSFGADWLGTWISPVRYGVKYGEFRQGHDTRGYLIHAESRMSLTAAAADKWLPVAPGEEGRLALSIASVIVNEELVPHANIDAYMANVPRGALDAYAPASVATGHITADTITDVARRFAGNRPSIALGGGSAGAHTNGLFNLTAIYALNILSGSVGIEGGIKYNPPAPLRGLPDSATGASFQAWEEELAQWRAGNVNTVIVRGVDLVHGLPRSVNATQALEKVPHVVQFAGVLDDTSASADLILPENSFLEDWGGDVPEPGPGYQTVGIRQPVVNAPLDRADRGRLYDSRGFLDVLLAAVRDRLGTGDMRRVVTDAVGELFALGRPGSSVVAPDRALFLNGVLQRGGWWDTGSARPTVAPSAIPSPVSGAAGPSFSAHADVEGDEFHLIPFAHQSLLDGRNAAAPWAQSAPDPITSVTWTTWAEINDRRARELGIREGQYLTLRSTTGEITVRAYPHPAVPPDVIGVPVGQGHAAGGRYAEGRGENVLSILVDKKDAGTGALAWAATRVRVRKSGGRKRLPKFEGRAQDAFEVEPGVPILLVRPGESAKQAQARNEESHLEHISNPE